MNCSTDVRSERTLLISEIFPPKTGGSGRWFYEIYRRLPQDQYLVAAGEDDRQAEFDTEQTMRILRLPLHMERWGVREWAGLRGYWRACTAVRRAVRHNQIRRLHCGRCMPEGVVAWLLNRFRKLPYVCFVHGEELATARSSREFTWLVRRVFAAADFVVANSQNTANLLHEQWGLNADRVRQLYPGVDAQRFVPAPRDATVRATLGWNDRTVILTVGRLQKRKGHDRLIRAIHRIRTAVPDVLYAIVGNGEERTALDALVREGGLENHVQFLGEIEDRELIRCYQQCDLFVLPNREVHGDFEGFGMVLVEAQACGRPVLAGASGGTRETMQIPQTGRVVACDDAEPLAEAVIDLLADRAHLEHMGRAARDWAVSRFDWTALGRQAEHVFRGERAPDDWDANLASISSVPGSTDAPRAAALT